MAVVVVKPSLGHIDQWYTENIALPTVDWWHRRGFTPNMLTSLGFLSSMLFAVNFHWQTASNSFLVLLIAIRMYFDYVDGLLARKHAMTSAFGDLYDHFNDWTFMLCSSYTVWSIRGMWALWVMAGAGTLCSMQLATVEMDYGSGHEHNLAMQSVAFFNPLVRHGKVKELLRYTDTSFFYLVLVAIVLSQ